MNFKLLIFITLLSIFLLNSCASRKPKVFMFKEFQGKKRVVVLPIKNSSKNVVIGRIIYRILLSELINSKSFSPVEEGIVREFLIKNMLFPGEFPNLNQLKILKSETNADIIIGGEVLQAGNESGDVKITLILWARDISNGKLLWTTYYVKRGDDYRKIFHFGKVFSLSELAIKMVDDIINTLEQKGG